MGQIRQCGSNALRLGNTVSDVLTGTLTMGRQIDE